MLMVIATSNTGDPVIISDHGTVASAVHAIYLNPEKIMGPIKQPIIGFVEAGEDLSIGTHIGQTQITFNFQGCTFPKDGTGGDWEIFLRGLAYWADDANDKTLYLQILDKDSYNIAKWPETPYGSGNLVQIEGKIVGLPQVDWSDSAVYRFNLQFVRLTL